MRALGVALCVCLAIGAARADSVTVGLFAPTAPFPSTAARVAFAAKLAEQVGKALGATSRSKVFARAGDFAAAVRSGEVTVALVDGTYLAATGGAYTVIAGAVRGGDTQHAWQLVARGVDKIGALRGKRVLVPAIGGHETDFVIDALLGGEVGKEYFSKLEVAPDTASAVAALALGKADAAIVPTGVQLPSGLSTVLALPVVAGPVLVAYGPNAAVRKAALATALDGFAGDATVSGFRAVDPDAIHALARRFAPPVKRGPFAVPALRVLVGDLVVGRALAIERTPAIVFTTAPVAARSPSTAPGAR